MLVGWIKEGVMVVLRIRLSWGGHIYTDRNGTTLLHCQCREQCVHGILKWQWDREKPSETKNFAPQCKPMFGLTTSSLAFRVLSVVELSCRETHSCSSHTNAPIGQCGSYWDDKFLRGSGESIINSSREWCLQTNTKLSTVGGSYYAR